MTSAPRERAAHAEGGRLADRIVHGGVLLLIAWVSLVPYRFLVLDHPLVILVNFFPLVLTMLLAGTLVLFRRAAVLSILRADVLFGAILALLLVDFLSAIGGVNTLSSLPRTVYYSLTGPVVYWVVICSLRSVGRQMSTLIAVSVFSGLAALYGVTEYVVGENWLFPSLSVSNLKFAAATGGAEFSDRALGTIGHPVAFGAFLLLSLPASLYLAGRPSRLRWVGIATATAVVVAMAVTFSRGAWISLVVAIVVWVVRHKAGYSARAVILRVLITSIMLGGMTVAILMTRGTYEEYIERFDVNPRVLAYGYTASLIPGHLLTGSGAGSFRWLGKPLGSRLDTTDNMYLTRLVEGGILGLATLLFLLIQIFRCLSHPPPDIPDEAIRAGTFLPIVLAVLLGAAVDMMTFDLLSMPSTRVWFWLQVAIAMGVIRAQVGDTLATEEFDES